MPEVYAAPPDYAFPRNFKGYGEKGLEGLKWPNNAKIAVSFVINYEEVISPLPNPHFEPQSNQLPRRAANALS